MWATGDNPTLVDGGLVDNLPISQLYDGQQEHGSVLAFSFSSPPSRAISGLKDFVLAIADAAISASELKARGLLPPEQVHLMSPRFGTFEFGEALRYGLSDFYSSTRDAAYKFLEDHRIKSEANEVLASKNPWAETNATARRVMNQLGLLYQNVEAGRPIKYECVKFSVFANSLREPTDPMRAIGDCAEFSLRFRTCDDEVNSLAVGLVITDFSSRFKTDTATYKVMGPDGPITCIAIPMSTELAPRDRDLCIFFDPPLPPQTGPYHVSFTEFGENLFQPLITDKRDEIGYCPRRPGGLIDELHLIAYVPANYGLEIKPRGVAKTQRALLEHECADTSRYPGLVAMGWCASDVDAAATPEDLWALDLFSK